MSSTFRRTSSQRRSSKPQMKIKTESDNLKGQKLIFKSGTIFQVPEKCLECDLMTLSSGVMDEKSTKDRQYVRIICNDCKKENAMKPSKDTSHIFKNSREEEELTCNDIWDLGHQNICMECSQPRAHARMKTNC